MGEADETLVEEVSEENTDTPFQVKSGGSQPLFADCPLTVATSGVLSMQFKLRHNLTEQALSDLLQLLKLHCPSPNQCVPSAYVFNKQFECLKYPIKFHYYCSRCLQEVEYSSSVCPNLPCSQNLCSLRSKSSFIEIPVEQQLKSLLSRMFAYLLS